MSEKGRKFDRLKAEFNGTNWATWHSAMQGPMHVAKATALAFEGKERPEEPANENNAANREAMKKCHEWDEANASGLQAIRAVCHSL